MIVCRCDLCDATITEQQLDQVAIEARIDTILRHYCGPGCLTTWLLAQAGENEPELCDRLDTDAERRRSA